MKQALGGWSLITGPMIDRSAAESADNLILGSGVGPTSNQRAFFCHLRPRVN